MGRAKFIWKPFTVSGDAPFLMNLSFWLWVVIAPLLVAVFQGREIYLEDGPLEWARTFEGCKYALAFYSDLAWVSGIIPAFFAVYIQIHKSNVTDQSLKLTASKTDFDRRFKHEEEFYKHLSGIYPYTISDDGKVEWTAVKAIPNRIFYLSIFPNNSVSLEAICADVDDVTSRLKDALREVDKNIPGATLIDVDQVLSPVSKVFPYIMFIANSNSDKEGVVSELTFAEYEMALKGIVYLVNEACKFMHDDPNIDSSFKGVVSLENCPNLFSRLER